jgi:hypothetical protein
VVNWGKKPARKIGRRKTLERWETEIGNCEVTPKAIWLVVKSLIKMDGPQAPTPIHGRLGHQPLEKTTMIVDFNSHRMTCVMKTIKVWQSLEFKHCCSCRRHPLGKGKTPIYA